MAQKTTQGKVRMSVFLLTLAVILGIIVATVVEKKTESMFTAYTLDDSITAELIRSDGTVTSYDTSYMDVTEKGDTAVFYIPLPEDMPYRENSVCFYIYNADYTLRSERGDILISNENPDNEPNYGDMLVLCTLPMDIGGQTLTLTVDINIDAAVESLTKVMIFPSEYSMMYPLIGNKFTLFICVTILCLAVVLLIGVIILIGSKKFKVQGISLCLFLIFSSVWIMGFNRLIYIFFGDVPFATYAEYLGLYGMPLTLSAYVACESEDKLITKLCNAFVVLYMIIPLSLKVTSKFIDYNFMSFTHIFRMIMVVTLLPVIVLRFTRGRKKDLSDTIMTVGIAVSMFILLLEVLRFEAKAYITTLAPYLGKSISLYGIIVLILSLAIGYVVRIGSYYMEKHQIEMMARIDGLTGIRNRRAFMEDVYREMTSEKHVDMRDIDASEVSCSRDGTLVFVDVNDLKKANDIYGHEIGDKLICFAATLLCETVGEDGFAGRYGGDEFVACLPGLDTASAEKYRDRFYEGIRDINETDEFPFEVNIAWGMASVKDDNPDTLGSLISLADERMYEKKRKMKAAKA